MSAAEALPLAALCLFALSDIGTDAEECRRQGPSGSGVVDGEVLR